jgi:penicillin-binding protein 2
VGLKLGIKKYAKWLDKFQFGQTNNLPFSQNPGVIPSEKFIKKYLNGKWYPGDMANVAIGQGYLTINVAQASIMTSIVASGGKIPELSVVKSNKKPVHENLKITESTLRVVQEGLLGVINNKKGTGFFARDDGKLAGKTGTAQVISKDARSYGYGKYRNHGWFTAYYPYDNPQIVISVFAEHGSSGGAAGGPIIKKIVKYYKKNYLKGDI